MKDKLQIPQSTSLAKPRALLSLVSIGPGDLQQMTGAAQVALRSAQVVIGYELYLNLVRPFLAPHQEVIVSPIGHEIERAQQAIDLAQAGRHVALVSSGDIGIYAMASPVFELLHQRNWQGDHPEVEVLPGVSAVQAAAARLGAPLGHDFCTISLSDLLTPWSAIERRLQAAAWGDFVIAFYNPRSQKRDWQLQRAIEILLAHRPTTTPVAIVRNVTRPDEQIKLTTLAELEPTQVDMFTLVLVGNSQSYCVHDYLVTPRGYEEKQQQSQDGPVEVPKNEVVEKQPGEMYPLTLTDMSQRQALVIGGGVVGQRKVQGLLAAGAPVRLISPEITLQLRAWVDAGRIDWRSRPYQNGDLAGAWLVFAATDQRSVNARIAEEAARLGILCNVADQPAEGNFHVPAVHRQAGLIVAVGTAGESPRRARLVRDQIAAWLKAEGEKGDFDGR